MRRRLLLLEGQRAEEVDLADVDAVVTQDRVGRGDVEVEVGQHVVIEVVAAAHGVALHPAVLAGALLGADEVVAGEGRQVVDDGAQAGAQLLDGLLGVGVRRRGLAGELGHGVLGGVAGRLDLAREGELIQKTEWLEKNIAEHAELVKTHEGLKQELEQRNRWAQELNQQLAASGERVVALQEELSAEQAAARETVARYEAKVGELEADLAAKVAWAQETEQRLTVELEGKIQELAKCVALLQQAEQTLEERTNWALTLDKQREELEAQLSAVQASRWHKLGRSIGLGPKGLGSR